MHHNQLRLHPHRAGSTFRYLYRYKYVSRPTAAGWVDLSSIVLAEFAFDCADAMYRVPPPPAETMTKGDDDDKRRTFPPPRQAVAAVRSRVFRRPGCRRHARSTERTYIIATPEAVAGCPLPTAPHIRQSGDESVKSERQRVPPRPLRSPRSPSYSPSLATDSGTPKRVLLLITTRHLRSCAGINNR